MTRLASAESWSQLRRYWSHLCGDQSLKWRWGRIRPKATHHSRTLSLPHNLTLTLSHVLTSSLSHSHSHFHSHSPCVQIREGFVPAANTHTTARSQPAVEAIGALMSRVQQPRTLLVLGLNAGMSTAAGADELVEVPYREFRPGPRRTPFI